jgi:hypothetical protein
VVTLLLSLLASLSGIDRVVDADLTAIAEARVVEIQGDENFNHDGWRDGTAEVLAWNADYPDPVAHAVGQWQGSPEHWAILADPTFTRIGCAHDLATDGRDYFVCVLAAGVPAVQPVDPTSGGELIPNTRYPMNTEAIKTFFTYLTALALILGGLAIIYLTRAEPSAAEIRLLMAGFIGAATQFLFSARVADQAATNATPNTTYVNARPPSTINVGDDGPLDPAG